MKAQEGPEESEWAELREAQKHALRLENTGLAVCIDVGDGDDLHPKNKPAVGRRLSLVARALTYGERIPYSGPVYEGYRIEGNTIRIDFSHTDKGLKTSDGGPVRGFYIAGPDHKFHAARAVIEGNTVVVSSAGVRFPVGVRYAWANNPVCNLCNGAGLPAGRSAPTTGRTARNAIKETVRPVSGPDSACREADCADGTYAGSWQGAPCHGFPVW